MQAISMVDRYLTARCFFFRWRCSLTLINKFWVAACMACVTGLLALIRVPLPFTPIPITGQVLGVLLSGVVCGGLFGSVSQIIYVGVGIAAGIPWFAGGAAYSAGVFFQPTGGYLIGFIVAPFVIGWYTDRHVSARSFLSQVKLMMMGIGIIYLFGTVVLLLVTGLSLLKVLLMGVVPFILIDLVKAFVAAGVSFSVLPKVSYNGEVDRTGED